MHKRFKWGAAIAIGGALVMPLSPLAAAEPEERSAYYEDDGWADITEWFDGNDYNPTDEAWYRWDDETYQLGEDTSGDRDSDRNRNFGYTAGNEDDWFYDRYDYESDTYTSYDAGDAELAGATDAGVTDARATHPGSGQGQLITEYYDYDKDRFYDAMSLGADTNGDGLAEEVDYYFFSDVGRENAQKQQQQQGQQAQQQGQQAQQQGQQAQQAAAKESASQSLSGKIQNMKEVQVRGTKHTVVQIAPEGQQGQPVVADLGKTQAIQGLNLKQGDQITVRGSKSKVGDKQIILANFVEASGQTKQIDRQGRQIQGKVLSTHKAKIRGTEHLIAMVQIQPQQQGQQQQGQQQQGDAKGAKVAVDLGPATQLQANVTEGSQITFTGVPIKVKDKRLVMAQSIKQGDQFVQIDRQQGQGNQPQPASATENPANQQKQQQQPQ